MLSPKTVENSTEFSSHGINIEATQNNIDSSLTRCSSLFFASSKRSSQTDPYSFPQRYLAFSFKAPLDHRALVCRCCMKMGRESRVFGTLVLFLLLLGATLATLEQYNSMDGHQN